MRRSFGVDQSLVFFFVLDLLDDVVFVVFVHQDAVDLHADHDPFDRRGQFAALDRKGMGAGVAVIGQNRDDHAEPFFQCAQMTALLVEDVERDFRTGPHRQVVGGRTQQMFFDRPQDMQGNRRHGAHKADAGAMRADNGRAFEHAGADALA